MCPPLRVILVALATLAAACSSGSPAEEVAPTTTIGDLAFTDTTPIEPEQPVLDEGAALTCLHLRDGLDALDRNDLTRAANALSAASLYIASTTTPGFADQVSSLVLFASVPTRDTESVQGLVDLCDSLLIN